MLEEHPLGQQVLAGVNTKLMDRGLCPWDALAQSNARITGVRSQRYSSGRTGMHNSQHITPVSAS